MEQNNHFSPYGLLSKYRSELMGLAILWVVLFHSNVQIPFGPYCYLKETGYGGVDIFLLVSGMGIYQSLQKNTISQFIKNRAKKILPVWWSCLVLYVALEGLFFNIRYSKLELLGFASFTGFWLDLSNQGNWYVYAIVLFYLISPVLVSLIKESKRRTAMCAALIAVSVAVSLVFVHEFKLIVFSRLPIYIIGMYFAAQLKDRPITRKDWVVCFALFLAGFAVLITAMRKASGYLWPYGLWWYPFILIAPTMSLLVCRILAALERCLSGLYRCLRALGQASLEILLASDLAFKYHAHLRFGIGSELLAAVTVLLIGITAGLLFHLVIEKATALVRRMTKK